MRALLATIGSAGDFRPVLAIATRLRARGHEVVLAANGFFETEVREAGLGFFPLGTREEYRQSVADPDIFHPRRGFVAVARRGLLPAVRPVYRWIEAAAGPDTVVAATSLCLGARIARDRLGVPLATLHLQPTILRSVLDTPVLPGLPLPRSAPEWLTRGVYRLADRMIDRVIGGELNGFREELGLPPVRRFFDSWIHSPDRVLGLFPGWFAAPQPDWPRAAVVTGFVAPGSRSGGLPGTLDRFLGSGDPPLVFTPGSAMARGGRFFAAAVEAAERLGRRAVLLTTHRDQLPRELPKSVFDAGWTPLGPLLARSAAFVHHGGIGSCAEGFAAGIPQLLMPMAHDQPDNAARIVRLGVGGAIPPKRFTGRRVAAALARLLDDPGVARRAADLAARVDFDASLDRACDEIEALPPGDAPSRLLDRPLAFGATGDAEVPYRVWYGGREWRVRVNDWPEEPTVYTLLADGCEPVGFDDWPEAWDRPEGGDGCPS